MDPSLPLWRRIETTLQGDVDSGTSPPGSQLPGEHALAARFGATRTTLRRALAELQAKGVIRVEKGRGAFVADTPPLDYEIGRRTTFGGNLRRHGLDPFARVVRAAELPAPADVARHLALKPGEQVTMIETVSEAQGLPLSLARHHLPAARFPDAARELATLDCISSLLSRRGVAVIERRSVRILARLPTADEAHHLRQSAGLPILQSETVRVDGDGRAVDYTLARFAAARVQFVLGEAASFAVE